MKQLVCLSCAPWTATPDRTQQLITRLRDVEILFFGPPGSGGRSSVGRRVRPNITAYPLPPRPEERREGRRPGRGERRLRSFLERTLEKHRFHEPLLWLDSPEYFAEVREPVRGGLVYDCAREWDDLPLEWESELALRADVAFAASRGLAGRLAPCCDNIALIPNGVNYPMFSREDWETPGPLAGRDRPILGRVGAITADLELEPLFAALSAHPEWTFLLVGEVEEELRPQLARYHNLVLAGRVPMVDVPDYLGSCQVCFDLLARRTRGSDILPGRIYEYLAVGNPVVLMRVPGQVEPLPDVVYTAAAPGDFVRCCEKALEEDPTWVRGRRRAYAQGAQWADRAGEVQRILETAMLL